MDKALTPSEHLPEEILEQNHHIRAAAKFLEPVPGAEDLDRAVAVVGKALSPVVSIFLGALNSQKQVPE